MRMLIVGAGAIGGYYGGRLAQAGRDVIFLVRPRRAAQLRDGGLQIQSPNGDVTVTPRLVGADALAGSYDAVLLAVKGFALEAVMEEMAPAIGPQTMILPALNGMRHVEMMAARFGPRAVAGCACKLAVELDAEGHIRQLNPQEDMAYGEMDGAGTDRIKALDAFMQGAGFAARLAPAIAREMWQKWILLAGLGGINCLMRGGIGEVAAAPGGIAFADALLDEIVAVVSAAGIAPAPDFVATARATLTAAGSPLTSSMYRDLRKGAPIEADQIIGDLVARGGKAKIATPLLAIVYANLCVYQNRLKA